MWLFDKTEFTCLVKNIYYEARGEPVKGQEAVALVTLNRIKSDQYKEETICSVVHKPWQFSWTHNKARKVTDKAAWKRAEEVAYRVLTDNHSLGDFSALNFHAKTVNPGWKKKRVATIGNHVFYK